MGEGPSLLSPTPAPQYIYIVKRVGRRRRRRRKVNLLSIWLLSFFIGLLFEFLQSPPFF